MATTKNLPQLETVSSDPFAYHVPPPSPITAADMVGPPFWHTWDLTNDPLYIKDGVRMMVTRKHNELVVATENTLNEHFTQLTTSSRYQTETPPSYGPQLGVSREQYIKAIDETLLPHTGYEPSGKCAPDVALHLPRVDIPEEEDIQFVQDSTAWIMEFNSPTTRQVDWHNKKTLYARMGVAEYWIQDRAQDGSIQISVFRLERGDTPEENTYPPEAETDQGEGCHSAVLGTRLRMTEAGLNLWDRVEGRWMDHDLWQATEVAANLNAAKEEGMAQGRHEGRREGRSEGMNEGAALALGNMATLYTNEDFGTAVYRHTVQMPAGKRPTVTQLMKAANLLPPDASAAAYTEAISQFLGMPAARTDTDAPPAAGAAV